MGANKLHQTSRRLAGLCSQNIVLSRYYSDRVEMCESCSLVMYRLWVSLALVMTKFHTLLFNLIITLPVKILTRSNLAFEKTKFVDN